MKSRIHCYINALILFMYLFKRGPSVLKYFLSAFSNKIIFKPMKTITYLKDKNKDKNGDNSHYFISETISTPDNILIDACLHNSYKQPSYNDQIIYLYSHGNAGDIKLVVKSKTIKYLSKYGSVFIYDYRGYGMSTGKPSDRGIFIDSRSVWTFLVNVKHVSPQNIILFGHSLGTSVSANLMLNILKTNTEYRERWPRGMILQNPFFSIHQLIDEHAPFKIKNFIISEFSTNLFFKQIDSLTNNITINIIHSNEDELISSSHSIDLHKLIINNKCQLFLVPGTHNTPIYDNIIDCMMIDTTSPTINDNK